MEQSTRRLHPLEQRLLDDVNDGLMRLVAETDLDDPDQAQLQLAKAFDTAHDFLNKVGFVPSPNGARMRNDPDILEMDKTVEQQINLEMDWGQAQHAMKHGPSAPA